MPTTPIIYRWDDPGAPNLTGKTDAFYEIVQACLINGYGNKSAAGWSVVYDDWGGSGVFTLTNRTQSGVLGIVRKEAASYGSGLFIANKMVSAVEPVLARSSHVRVTDVAHLYDEEHHQSVFGFGSDHQHWTLIANDQACVFFSMRDLDDYTNLASSFSWAENVTVYFGAISNHRGLGGVGDAKPGNFILLGGRSGKNVYTSAWPYKFGVGGRLASLSGANGGLVLSELQGCVTFVKREGEFIDDVQAQTMVPLNINVKESLSAQLGWIPMLLQSVGLYLGSQAVPYFSEFGRRETIGGKQYALLPVFESWRLVVSLEEEDWQ